jgi:hypothetical protein
MLLALSAFLLALAVACFWLAFHHSTIRQRREAMQAELLDSLCLVKDQFARLREALIRPR